MSECLNCGHDLSGVSFPYGDDVVCPHCGAVHETDSEYSTDSMVWWIVRLRESESGASDPNRPKPGP